MRTATALPDIPTQLVTAAQEAFAALQEADNAIGDAGTTALRRAMEAGDSVIRLEEFAPNRGKQKFLTDKIGAKLATIKVCKKLAQGRDLIEKELASASQMSIRSALKLLRPEPKEKKPPRLSPEAWNGATDQVRQEYFDQIEATFLRSLTDPQRRRIFAKLSGGADMPVPRPSPAYRPIPRTVREVNDDINRAIGALE
jgi:hypothetical protein